MDANIIYIIFFTLINLLFVINFNKISRLYKVYDYPDNIRKKHIKKMPLLGGIMILMNLFFLLLLSFISIDNFQYSIFLELEPSISSYSSLFFISLLIFIVGYFDDKYNLTANQKIIVLSLILLIAIQLDSELILKELYFSIYDLKLKINDFATLFTLICILLFINSFNMLDGMNLLGGIYALILFMVLAIYNYNLIYIVLSIAIIFFLFLNYKNKSFLGDSGSLLISYLISISFIKEYNINRTFFADEIIIFMMIPGLDLLRLSMTRIFSGNSPFRGDRNHMHHLVLNKYSNSITIIMISIIVTLPILLHHFIFTNTIFTLLVSVFIYCLFILLLSRK